MCVNDIPLVRALPYIIAGLVFVGIAVLLSMTSWSLKSRKRTMIFSLCVAGLFFVLAVLEFMTRYKCL